MGLLSWVPLSWPKMTIPTNESTKITANEDQYTCGLYSTFLKGMVKYEDVKVTGINRIEILAKRIVMRVRFSMKDDSLMVMRLKFYILMSTGFPNTRRGSVSQTRVISDSFSSKHA